MSASRCKSRLKSVAEHQAPFAAINYYYHIIIRERFSILKNRGKSSLDNGPCLVSRQVDLVKTTMFGIIGAV